MTLFNDEDMTERLGRVGEEFLDIVDDQDTVIGQCPRSKIKLTEFCNVRSVAGFLVNREGRVWIPRRTTDKRLFPSSLDMSFAGYVASGEDYPDAARREMEEELHLDHRKVQLTKAGKLSPYDDGVASFITVYLVRMDESPEFDTSDFSEAFWVTPDELVRRLKSGESAKSDLLKLAERFLSIF